jgi:hypothetical protein
MKRILLTTAFLLLTYCLFAQKYKVGLNVGYGVYKLDGLKELQEYLADYNSELNVQAVQQFPGYLNYSASFEYYLGTKNLLGINGAFFSTGGRNSVKDYSGEYTFDMPLNGYRLGLQYRYLCGKYGKFSSYFQAVGGTTISTLSFKESLDIYNVESYSNKESYASASCFIEPSGGFFYDLGNHISANFSLGYQFEFLGSFRSVDDIKHKIYYSNNEPIRSDWTGFRILLGVTYDMVSD